MSNLQGRLANWQHRRGTARVVASITAVSVLGSAVICLGVYMVVYGGFGGMMETVDITALTLPIAVPLLVAPVATLQLAGALGIASSLIGELEGAHTKLEAEITRREAAQNELERLARCDPLTGLLNRRGFFDALAALDPEDLDTLMLTTVDIDRFKSVNDDHGHAFGDRVLCTVGAALAATAGEDAIVARMGGDEFVAALVDADATDRAVRDALTRVVIDHVDTGPLAVRCSVGSAIHSADCSIDVTLARADVALYEDKPGYLGSGRTRSSAR